MSRPERGHTLLVVVWRQLTVPARREFSESFRSRGQGLESPLLLSSTSLAREGQLNEREIIYEMK